MPPVTNREETFTVQTIMIPPTASGVESEVMKKATYVKQAIVGRSADKTETGMCRGSRREQLGDVETVAL
jgi:hypothetical protein